MKLVVGGAYQGKTAYAQERYQIENWIDGRDCEFEELFSCAGIHHFHAYVKRLLQAKMRTDHLVEELCQRNRDVVLVTNELGYGVVPLEAFDREYRETTGRICCLLAKEAEEVVRVVCGIGTVIRHD